MGCTSSKATRHPRHSHQEEQIIPEQFRHWIESNRTQADALLLEKIQPNHGNDDDDRTICRKIVELLLQRPEMKTTQKLTKALHKELPTLPLKTIERTVDLLKDAFDTANLRVNETKEKTAAKDILPVPPGIVLKDALETARILFYKGKQAAIFANPNGGYDVRIVDEDNLRRSIVVTEVKLRPKGSTPSTLLRDETSLNEDFRRSIDAALKGLQAIERVSTDETHPMVYTEIIQSQSHDGEESRRVKSRTYDEVPMLPNSLQVITKSEFSSDRTSGDKRMEQSVQVISVQVRNETKVSAHDENEVEK